MSSFHPLPPLLLIFCPTASVTWDTFQRGQHNLQGASLSLSFLSQENRLPGSAGEEPLSLTILPLTLLILGYFST